MTSRLAAIGPPLLAAGTLVLAGAGCGGGKTSATPAPAVTRVAIVVRDGGVVGGIERATIEKGSRVVLVLTSDVADEVHLHGYDKHLDVTPGKVGRLPFVATARGRFEVELEDHHLQIADLTVK